MKCTSVDAVVGVPLSRPLCRLVMNAATQKPKGTAFVEFETAEDAQNAAAACKRAR